MSAYADGVGTMYNDKIWTLWNCMEMDEIMIGFSVAAYSLLFLVILLAQIPFCSFYVENLFVKENKRQRSFFSLYTYSNPYSW